mmetsp:Transcript_72895/g.171403  ORF Transcript_72895/g.171403 Transcript_72895/m.171403 type:complete len:140 (-) Transcript_72895:390-809(-)
MRTGPARSVNADSDGTGVPSGRIDCKTTSEQPRLHNGAESDARLVQFVVDLSTTARAADADGGRVDWLHGHSKVSGLCSRAKAPAAVVDWNADSTEIVSVTPEPVQKRVEVADGCSTARYLLANCVVGVNIDIAHTGQV